MLVNLLYKGFRKVCHCIRRVYDKSLCRIILKGNDITYSSFHTNGVPYIMVARGGRCFIGRNFMMNNGIKGNPIGCYERCTFLVDRGAV